MTKYNYPLYAQSCTHRPLNKEFPRCPEATVMWYFPSGVFSNNYFLYSRNRKHTNIRNIISWISNIIYAPYGLCVFSLPVSLLMIVRMFLLFTITIVKSEIWILGHCLGLDHSRVLYVLFCITELLRYRFGNIIICLILSNTHSIVGCKTTKGRQ